jgi:hypothetical protein
VGGLEVIIIVIFLVKCQCEISNEDTNEEEESISCELFVLENKKIDSRTSSFIISKIFN